MSQCRKSKENDQKILTEEQLRKIVFEEICKAFILFIDPKIVKAMIDAVKTSSAQE